MKIYGKKIVAILFTVLLLSTVLPLISVSAATEDAIENSIQKGLDWLVPTQNPDGSWGDYEYVAHTAFAVLKLIDRAKELDQDPFDPAYQYHVALMDGMNFLFMNAYTMPIAVQPAGDPDTNGNGIGVYFENPGEMYHRTYSTGSSLMAMGAAAATNPVFIVPIGPLAGWTLSGVVQETVDYAAFGQNEGGDERGGWGYYENYGWSDNSNSGWMTLGIGYALTSGANIPQFLFDELNIWIDFIQNDVSGGSGYDHPDNWVNMLKTGNLLYQMALVGDDKDSARAQAAIAYQEATWNALYDPGYMIGGHPDYQYTYCIMKGFEALGVETINMGGDMDWFDVISTEIVLSQNADGSWPPGGWDNPTLATTWALLTLEKAVAIPQIAVDVDIKPGSWPNPFNKKAKGVFAVAICGTEDFDVSTIDPASVVVSLDMDTGVSPVKWHYEDAATPYEDMTPDEPDGHELTGDGLLDLMLHFDRQEVVELGLCEYETGDFVRLYIMGFTGENGEGIPIQGLDWIRVKK